MVVSSPSVGYHCRVYSLKEKLAFARAIVLLFCGLALLRIWLNLPRVIMALVDKVM